MSEISNEDEAQKFWKTGRYSEHSATTPCTDALQASHTERPGAKHDEVRKATGVTKSALRPGICELENLNLNVEGQLMSENSLKVENQRLKVEIEPLVPYETGFTAMRTGTETVRYSQNRAENGELLLLDRNVRRYLQ